MSVPSRSSRDFDVIVWGATGFTGRLVTLYLADTYGSSNVRFAIAGRDKSKLDGVVEFVRSELNKNNNIDVFTASITDAKSLDDLFGRTKVVIAAVGPFLRHGLPVVESCCRMGTDYVDITGETPFIKFYTEKFNQLAEKSGAAIISCCGFDSLPSELTALVAVRSLQREGKEDPSTVHGYFSASGGGVSGGTIASFLNLISDKSLLSEMKNPFFLNEVRGGGKSRKSHDSDQMLPAWSADIKGFTAPFVMAGVNTRVVRRSAELFNKAGKGYGNQFSYNESMSVGKGLKSLVYSVIVVVVLGLFMVCAAIPPIRKHILPKFLPAPGQGPSMKAMKTSRWKVRTVARGERGGVVEAQIRGENDGGYMDTSKMLTESALTLALDREKLDIKGRGGCFTPAFALGETLVERINSNTKTIKIDVQKGLRQ